ncbi:uncharacterized protein [Dermacentor andersoni]|uniref:uncharacterized protein n=1 Tax=Dermacentor andersoni TaxID=34620 RepID=UPI003B3BC998
MKNAAEAKAQCNVPGTVSEASVSDETVEACTSSLSSVQYEKTDPVGASIENESACMPVQESQPGCSKDSAPWPHVEEPPLDSPVVAMEKEIRHTECGQGSAFKKFESHP